MKVIFALLTLMLNTLLPYGASPECTSAFFSPYQKATKTSESISKHNLFGYTREWSTFRYSNGVKFHRMVIEGEVLNQNWSRDNSPYNRAIEVVTAYFGRVKLQPKQDYFLFFEQGSKELFSAYQNFIQRPLPELEYLANSNRDNITDPVSVFKKAKSQKAPVVIKSNRKKVVPRHVRKHKITFYISSGVIFAKITDLYKKDPAQDYYLTLVKTDVDPKALEQLIQVLYSFNGFKHLPDKPQSYLNTHKFDIARSHPLFHIQQLIKKQNNWFNKILSAEK